jgi:hypothetical protein
MAAALLRVERSRKDGEEGEDELDGKEERGL